MKLSNSENFTESINIVRKILKVMELGGSGPHLNENEFKNFINIKNLACSLRRAADYLDYIKHD